MMSMCVYVSGKEITIRFLRYFLWKVWVSFSSSVDVRCSYFGYTLVQMPNGKYRQPPGREMNSAWTSNRGKNITCTSVQIHSVYSIPIYFIYPIHNTNYIAPTKSHTDSVDCVRILANRNHMCKNHTHYSENGCHSYFVSLFQLAHMCEFDKKKKQFINPLTLMWN